jgi:hypothetical protein
VLKGHVITKASLSNDCILVFFLEGKLVTIGLPSMTRTSVEPTTMSYLMIYVVTEKNGSS